eukprot:83009_1
MAKKRDVPFNYQCESISTCPSIHRIILCLNKYHKLEDLNQFHTIFNSGNHTHLNNDFNHILMQHLGDNKSVIETADEYEQIYNHMNGKVQPCDFEKCGKFIRNNRHKETQHIRIKDRQIEYYIELLDTIHCYFLHSFDVGFRIKNTDLQHGDKNTCDNESKKDKESTLTPHDVSFMLQNKRCKLQSVRGLNRTQNTKYVTNTNAVVTQSDEKQIENADKTYSFGHRYSYWREHSKTYVKPKYKDLYTELVNNSIYKITEQVYKSIVRKANKILSTQYCKGLHAKLDPTMLMRQITCRAGDPVTRAHVMSVLFYTDFSDLSYHFSSTFRSLHNTDTFQICRARNSEYCHMSKLLIEMVNLFGCSLTKSKIPIFYHGISELLIFSSFITIFNAPTSTTTQLSAATVFADTNGAILELTKYHGSLKYFNCSWLSNYANEDERLFISPPHPVCQLRISSIRSVKENANYLHYIHALTTLDYMIRSQTLRGGYTMNAMDARILKGLFADKQCPIYIKRLFEVRAKQTRNVCVAVNQIQNMHKVLFNEWIFKIDTITKIFTNCKTISVNYHQYNGGTSFFHCGNKFFASLLAELTALNQNKDERALTKIKLQKVKCNWKTLMAVQTKYKEQNWDIVKTDKREVSGVIVLSKCDCTKN